MKRLICSLATFLLVCSALFSQNDNIKATTKESDDAYEYSAEFNKNKNPEIVKYMDNVLGKSNNFSFENTKLDSKMTLDDKSTFYMKLSPGNVKIKFSKKENTMENYKRLKRICQGVNEIVQLEATTFLIQKAGTLYKRALAQ